MLTHTPGTPLAHVPTLRVGVWVEVSVRPSGRARMNVGDFAHDIVSAFS